MKYEFQILDEPALEQLDVEGSYGWCIVSVSWYAHNGNIQRVLMQRAITE